MDKLRWRYYSPIFESDQINLEMMRYSPWSDHRLFAYDYVSAIRPNCIVELGSFYGCSSFAFLQAIKDKGLKTEFYSIDTWKGDSFTENDYKENVYSHYLSIEETLFKNQEVNIIRSTFDEAVDKFPDDSIDLLHIDGSHKYDDVKHDFLTWKKKVKRDGVIFFHDIGDDLLDGELLGSHFFWEELKAEYKYTFEFPFSFGLGILFFDEKLYEAVSSEIDLLHYQKASNHEAVKYKDVLRKQFFMIKNYEKNNTSLLDQVNKSQAHLAAYAENVKGKDAYIHELKNQHNKIIQDYKITVSEKDKYIVQLEMAVKGYGKAEDERNDYIRSLEKKIGSLQDIIVKQESDIKRINREYDDNLAKYKETDDAKTGYIAELELSISKYKETVGGKDQYIKVLEKAISEYKVTEVSQKKYQAGLERQIKELQKTITKLMQDIERINADYNQNLENYKDNNYKKTKYIEELKETIEKYTQTVRLKDDYITRLETANKELQSDHLELEQYAREIERQVSEMKDAINELMDDISHINKDYAANIAAYKKTEEGKDEYIRELEDANTELQNDHLVLEQYAHGLERQVSEMKDTIHELMDDIGHINKDYAENIAAYKKTEEGKNKYIKELEAVVEINKSNEEKSTEQINELQALLTEKEQNVHLLSGRLIDAEEVQKELETELDKNKKDHRKMVDELEDKIIELEAESIAQKEEIQNLTKNLKNAMNNTKNDQDRINKLQEELDLVKGQITFFKHEVEKLPFGHQLIRRMM